MSLSINYEYIGRVRSDRYGHVTPAIKMVVDYVCLVNWCG